MDDNRRSWRARPTTASSRQIASRRARDADARRARGRLARRSRVMAVGMRRASSDVLSDRRASGRPAPALHRSNSRRASFGAAGPAHRPRAVQCRCLECEITPVDRELRDYARRRSSSARATKGGCSRVAMPATASPPTAGRDDWTATGSIARARGGQAALLALAARLPARPGSSPSGSGSTRPAPLTGCGSPGPSSADYVAIRNNSHRHLTPSADCPDHQDG